MDPGIIFLILFLFLVIGILSFFTFNFYSKNKNVSDVTKEFAEKRGWQYFATSSKIKKELALPFGWGISFYRDFCLGQYEGLDFILFRYVKSNGQYGAINNNFVAIRLPPHFPEFKLSKKIFLNLFGIKKTANNSFETTISVKGNLPELTQESRDQLRIKCIQIPKLVIQSKSGWLFVSADMLKCDAIQLLGHAASIKKILNVNSFT